LFLNKFKYRLELCCTCSSATQLPVTAFFRRSLVLTYAFPGDLLQPLLPPGLLLDGSTAALDSWPSRWCRPSGCGPPFFRRRWAETFS
jgi:hypothetical protein